METVETILKTIIAVFGICISYRAVLTVLGLILPAKKFKSTDKQYNYAVMIGCRNEEKVIVQLIESLRKQNYPADKITIFVCADRCTDNTAQVARDAGAIVYERTEDMIPKGQRRSKGYAIDFILQNIKKDYPEHGIQTFDGYFMFDADNLLSENFVTEMNKAFDDKKYDFFNSYINIKNFGTTFVSSYSSISSLSVNTFSGRPRGILGLGYPARGKGVLYRNFLLVDGWKWCNMAIDTNSSSELFSKGYRSTFCNTAELYDEQALSLKIYFRQNMRWARGRFNAFCRYFLFLMVGIFLPIDWRKKNRPESYNKKKFSLLTEVQKRLTCYDHGVGLVPLPVLTFIVTILYPLGRIIYGICVPGSFEIGEIAIIIPLYYGMLYLSTLGSCLATFIRESHRARVKVTKILKYILFWPLIEIMLQYVKIWALLFPVRWKTIPHVDTKTIEQMESEKTIAEQIIKEGNSGHKG